MSAVTQFGEFLGLGTPELIIIAVIILLIFGGSQLPKLAKNIGTSAKELKGAMRDEPKDKDKKESDEKK